MCERKEEKTNRDRVPEMKNATTGNGNRVYVSVSSQFSVHMTAKYV